jgi:hypothetical protein
MKIIFMKIKLFFLSLPPWARQAKPPFSPAPCEAETERGRGEKIKFGFLIQFFLTLSSFIFSLTIIHHLLPNFSRLSTNGEGFYFPSSSRIRRDKRCLPSPLVERGQG